MYVYKVKKVITNFQTQEKEGGEGGTDGGLTRNYQRWPGNPPYVIGQQKQDNEYILWVPK